MALMCSWERLIGFSLRAPIVILSQYNCKQKTILRTNPQKSPCLPSKQGDFYFQKSEYYHGLMTDLGYSLSLSIHLFVVLFVFARGDVVHPLLVVEIPAHSFFDAFFKLERRFPTEFFFQLR